MLEFDQKASPEDYVKFIDDRTVEYPGSGIDQNGNGVDVIVRCREGITRESGAMKWRVKCEECPFWKPVFGVVSAKETDFTEWDNMWCVNVRGMWGSSAKYPNVDVNKEGKQEKWDFQDGDIFELSFDPYTALLTMKNERLNKSTTRKLLGDVSAVYPAVKVYHDNNQCGVMRIRLLGRQGQSKQEWDDERKTIATMEKTMQNMAKEMATLRQEVAACKEELATTKVETSLKLEAMKAEMKALIAQEIANSSASGGPPDEPRAATPITTTPRIPEESFGEEANALRVEPQNALDASTENFSNPTIQDQQPVPASGTERESEVTGTNSESRTNDLNSSTSDAAEVATHHDEEEDDFEFIENK